MIHCCSGLGLRATAHGTTSYQQFLIEYDDMLSIIVSTTLLLTLLPLSTKSVSVLEDVLNINAIDPSSGKEYNMFDVGAPNPYLCAPTEFPPDPKTACCGVVAESTVPLNRKKRSIGGEGTTLEEYPWLALLEPKMDSGFLISSRYVVTAAACLMDGVNISKPTNVRLGDYNKFNQGKDCVKAHDGKWYCNDGALSIAVADVMIHSKYNESKYRNDIGLIKLKEMVPFTKYIRPICLPSMDITEKAPKNLHFDFIGWGVVAQYYNPLAKFYTDVEVPERLRVNLAFRTIEECAKLWGWELWNKHICAGGDNKSPCHGDGGGPLMFKYEGRFQVIGLSTNTAIPCGFKNGPGVFTNVFKYKSWVLSQMELMSEDKR